MTHAAHGPSAPTSHIPLSPAPGQPGPFPPGSQQPPFPPGAPPTPSGPTSDAPSYPPGAGFPAPGWVPGPPAGYGPPDDRAPGFGQPALGPVPAAAAPSLTLAGGAQLLAVVLTGLGLSIPFTDANFWSTSLAWALFAMTAALVQLAPLFGRNSQGSPRKSWLVGACGTGGLLGFWVLIALPGVSSNQGFVLTLAVAAAVAGSWLSPGRPR